MSKRILFFAAAVVLMGVGLYFRQDNARQARLQADKLVQVDITATPSAQQIDELKSYVASHMGASVSFTLKGSYDRAQVAAQAAASAASSASSQLYAEAQKACAGRGSSVAQARCNQEYLSARLSAAPTPAPVPAPKAETYRYQLKAPFWTPDLAGALLLGGAVSLLLSLPYQKLKVRR